jgi:hypothetical protein
MFAPFLDPPSALLSLSLGHFTSSRGSRIAFEISHLDAQSMCVIPGAFMSFGDKSEPRKFLGRLFLEIRDSSAVSLKSLRAAVCSSIQSVTASFAHSDAALAWAE